MATRQTDRQTERQAARQTDRQTNRQTDRQTDRPVAVFFGSVADGPLDVLDHISRDTSFPHMPLTSSRYVRRWLTGLDKWVSKSETQRSTIRIGFPLCRTSKNVMLALKIVLYAIFIRKYSKYLKNLSDFCIWSHTYNLYFKKIPNNRQRNALIILESKKNVKIGRNFPAFSFFGEYSSCLCIKSMR